MVTNQDGLGTASFPEDTFWPTQQKIIKAFANEGIHFEEIIIDRTFERDGAPTRKPGTALLQKYIHGPYNMSDSFVIGDRDTDILLAKNLGCKAIFLGSETKLNPALATKNWEDIYTFLKAKPRIGSRKRTTNETDIEVVLNLDGMGKASISSGIGFFDHMLEQIAKHGNLDLSISVKGDLHIDEHHTIEDVAITLGETFNEVLSTKKGIERYGFLLPMDDCLAQVAIDFGGRPWLEWDVAFTREKVGEMPTEMVKHFFKSFSDHAKCNLNIKAEGQNEHHKIESIFKAFARSIKSAVSKNNSNYIPSTKGII
jgi:imidazoleglycerol-phosphate dehydratase/histidinol-phosphatase